MEPLKDMELRHNNLVKKKKEADLQELRKSQKEN